ncbi:DUF7660 family protein [Streptomyces sp. NPDC057540]|uniref:DUF7660 family protein n=1 Tax=Streptomyces sp. NPDC057540 TaxID=3346160 RepID=UPI0036AA2018
MPISPEERLDSRDDFVTFLRALHREFQEHGHTWENATLERFLEALAGWANDAPGWYRHAGETLPPDGDWTFFARALAAATVYE